MKRLRLSFALLFGWLFLLYNVERLYEPINIASFVYVLAGAGALPLVLLPRLSRIAMVNLALPLAAAVVGLKAWLGYPIGGLALPLTITEICAATVSVALAHHLGRTLHELGTSVVSTLVSHLADETGPFERGLEEMYREVRRARAFKRPFTLLAIAPTRDSFTISLDRFTKEMHQEAVRHYVHARFARVLSKGTKRSDIITRVNDRFVMLLPETGLHKIDGVVKKLHALAKSELGLDIAVGASAFPEDEVTFVKLVERALARMDLGPGADLGDRGQERPAAATEPRVAAARNGANGNGANGSGNGANDGGRAGKVIPVPDLAPAAHYANAARR